MEPNRKPDLERSCRFCFEPGSFQFNPLVTPCECRGSQKYIHMKCLNRWRQQNPSANMITCFVCKTPYTIELIYCLEELPQQTYFYKPLQYPYVLYIVYHYITAIFVITINQTRTLTMYEGMRNSEFLFHCLFLLFAFVHFKVHKKTRYLSHWKREGRWMALPFHIFIVYLSSYYPNSYAILTSGLYLPIHWRTHIMILREMNIEDTQETN